VAEVLRTERLLLRQITESDGEGLFDIFADEQVTEHYAWDAFTSVGQGHELAARTAGQFRRREAIRWGLLPPGSPRIIGCGYTRWSQENRFAGNTASAALLDRAGFRREGVLRERALKRGVFRDVWMYGITDAEWSAAAGAGRAELGE
jgi:RimJ/RimL family protein N-acetyltransferase